MPLEIKISDEVREIAPEGLYYATIQSLIDKGTHKVEYKGQTKGHFRQYLVTYELNDPSNPGNMKKDGSPFTVISNVNITQGDRATFTKMLKACFGVKFYKDLLTSQELFTPGSLLKKSLYLEVVHNESKGTTYANVNSTSITGVPGGVVVPPLFSEAVFFSLSPDEFSPELYNSLSDYMKEIISATEEYKECVGKESKEGQF